MSFACFVHLIAYAYIKYFMYTENIVLLSICTVLNVGGGNFNTHFHVLLFLRREIRVVI